MRSGSAAEGVDHGGIVACGGRPAAERHDADKESLAQRRPAAEDVGWNPGHDQSRDVPLQMLLASPMIRAMVNAVQYRSIAPDPVGVAVVSDILASGMADSLLMRRHGVDRRVTQEAGLSAQQGK